MKEEVASLDASVEDWGRADSLAEGLAGGGISGRAARRAAAASSRHVNQDAEAANAAAVSVLGSGNLGLLYVHSGVRLTLDDLQEGWPASCQASVHMKVSVSLPDSTRSVCPES